MLVGDCNWTVGFEGRVPSEQLIEHDAGRVEVSARVGELPASLLGREVTSSAENRACLSKIRGRVGDRSGDAEIHHLHLARGGDHDVARLDVKVNDPRLMRVLERGENSLDDPHRLGRIERYRWRTRSLSSRPSTRSMMMKGQLQLTPVRVRHRLLTGVVDAHDSRVAHARSSLCLLPEARAEARIGRRARGGGA